MIGDGKNKVVHSWKIRSRSGGQIQYSSMTVGRRIHINARKITAFSLMLIMVVSSLLAIIVTYDAMNGRSTALWTNTPPFAVINGTDTGIVGEMMSFNGSSSYDSDGTISSYLWEFSDGRTFSGPIAYHVFADYGNYYVNLTVTDNATATGKDSMTVMIWLEGPVAKIAMPTKATEDCDVFLSGAQSYFFGDRPDNPAPGRTIINYSWNFGDGLVGYGVNQTHQWASTGSYIVTLTVKDNGGNWSRPAAAVFEILPAGASAIGVSLGRHSLLPSETTDLTISIVDACGNVVTDFTGGVSIACNKSSGVTKPSSYAFTLPDAGVHTFIGAVSFGLEGQYNISASVDANSSILGYDFATVCNRTVEIKIYDIFQGPLPDYWLMRSKYYLLSDEGFRNTSPAIEIYRFGDNNAGQLSTVYSINVEARNIPEYNMSSPTFTALKNPTTGKGNVTIDLDYYTLTQAQVLALDGVYIPPGKANDWDGWEIFLTNNVTMDRAAASQIIGLPLPTTLIYSDAGDFWYYLDNPANLSWWWDADISDGSWMPGNFTTQDYWDAIYLGGEGGYGVTCGRLDMKSCEDYYNFGQGMWSSSCMRLVYVDADHVTLSYWQVGYSYSELISRWLYWGGPGSGANYPNGTPNGIVPFEPWYDHMSLDVNISDDRANVSMSGVVIYSFRAWTSDAAPAGTATFRWEVIRLDYLVSISGFLSEMDVYAPNRDNTDPKYQLRDPGSSRFGETAKYDYVPANVQLKLGESLIIEAPKTLAVGYRPKAMTGNYSIPGPQQAGEYNSIRMQERFGNATIHPVGALPGTTSIDARTGDLKIVGPFIPIVKYISTIPWLIAEPAPRIELWVGPQEIYAPCAGFLFSPLTGDSTTVFDFNGSYSGDVEDSLATLEVRWDWDGDGTWDTGWSTSKVLSHPFGAPGDYTVLMEVKDSDGLTNITALQVHVDVVIPEFADLAIPIISMVVVIAFFGRRRSSQREEE